MPNRFVSLLTLSITLLIVTTAPTTASPQPDPAAVLKHVLGLTDVQILELQQLMGTRRAAIEPLIGQMQPLERELAMALESGSADPATVGGLVLSIRALQLRVARYDSEFRENFQNLLTPDQRNQLQAIRGVEAAFRAAEALRLLGL